MIDTTRFLAAGEVDVPLDLHITVRGTPLQAWRLVSTTEGWRAFMGVEGTVEAAIGGRFELMFSPELPLGQRGTEGCRVLAFVPGSMIAFSWNAPPELPHARAYNTWVVMDFSDAGKGQCHVRLRHLGFGQGGQWPDTIRYFERAWAMVLQAMQKHLAA